LATFLRSILGTAGAAWAPKMASDDTRNVDGRIVCEREDVMKSNEEKMAMTTFFFCLFGLDFQQIRWIPITRLVDEDGDDVMGDS
jgi:hypothetical protein